MIDLGSRSTRWDENRSIEEMAVTVPLSMIGSNKGNSLNGQIDGVVVLNRYAVARELNLIAGHTGSTLP